MDNESEVIRHQMEETRSSLQDKLEVLEQQVLNTVQDASQTVENVKDTMEAVKDTVQGTAETVKETVQDTVQSVKDTLSIERQVREHPWAMMAGAAVVGFLGGRVLLRLTAIPSPPPPQPAPAFVPSQPSVHRKKTNGLAAALPRVTEPGPSFWNTVVAHYGEEIDKLKKLAVSAVGGVARELIAESTPPALAEGIKDIVDGVTAKLGGTPLEGPILNFDVRQTAFGRKAS